MGETLLRACPFCGRKNPDAKALEYSRAPWALKECGGCGFVYLENPPKYEALSENFAWEQTYEKEKEHRAAAEPVVFRLSRGVVFLRRRVFKRDKLRRLLRTEIAPGRLLDVGCGHGGSFLDWNGKFIPHGVEISKELARRSHAIAEKQGGYVIHANAIEGLGKFPAAFFSGAILSSFLEHEVNPRALLTALNHVMAPGGRVVIKVPNYGCINRGFRGGKWCGFRFPDHVNYFTPVNLRTMVEESGFSIAKFGPGDRFPLSDNMWMVAARLTA